MNKFYFDKIISVKLEIVDEDGKIDTARTLEIKTTSSGLKPDIEFEISMLQDALCYDCTLTIRNFMYVPDIRLYNSMEITAGYKYSDLASNEQTNTFHMAIFSSWQESPNPDGVTVFRGITVGRVYNIFSEKPVTVTVNGETTVGNLIKRTALGASGYIDNDAFVAAKAMNNDASVLEVRSYIPEEYMNMLITLPNQLQAVNGIAILESLYETLYAFFKSLDTPLTYIQHLYDGVLNVGLLEVSEKLAITQGVVNITSVYSASYNAALLNIEAPWDPTAQPGSVVRISTRYFNGQNAPNVIDIREPALLAGQPLTRLTTEEINTGAGLYRILTSKVQFSSCHDTNKMSLLLIPITYSREQAKQDQETSYQNWTDTVSKERTASTTNVVIGTEKISEETKEIFQAGIQGSYAVREEYIAFGTTFSNIAMKYYGTDTEDLYKTRDQYSGKVVLSIKDDGTRVMGKDPRLVYRGISIGRSNAWPLILMATYKAYETDKLRGRGQDSKYKVNLNDPDTLPPGTWIRIPVLPSSNDAAVSLIAQNKTLFKAMANYYMKNLNNSAKPWSVTSAIKQSNMFILAGGSYGS